MRRLENQDWWVKESLKASQLPTRSMQALGEDLVHVVVYSFLAS